MALQEARNSGQMAIAAKQDSSAMKGIAVLTMFFLPATFLAVRAHFAQNSVPIVEC